MNTRRHLLLLLISISSITAVAQDTASTVTHAPLLMRDVFANMPQNILPLITKNNRLDCIDFIENNMEARVRNAIDEYITLDSLSNDFLQLQTSTSSSIVMKLLPADSTQIIVLIRSVKAGAITDSNIQFYTTDWQLLNTSDYYTPPAITDFFTDSPSTDEQKQAQKAIIDFHPIELRCSSNDTSLQCILQTEVLDRTQRQSIADITRVVTLRWDGKCFVSLFR